MKALKIIPEEDIKLLFSNVETLLTVNTEIHKNLQSISQVVSNLGELFLQSTELLKFYNIYSSNYELALQTYDRLNKMKDFVSFLRECESKPECTSGGLLGKFFNIFEILVT